MQKTRSLAAFFALLHGFTTLATGQGVVFVDASASPPGDGTSWATAYSSLSEANVAADAMADPLTPVEVWVKAGTYFPSIQFANGGPGTESFFIRDNVQLLGGFAGNEVLATERDPAVNVCVLSGDLGVPGDITDNCNHVVRATGPVTVRSVLDGFTIQDGNADNSGGRGGGILADEPFIIRRCLFTNNFADDGGAAIRQSSGLGTEIEDCLFEGNISRFGPGGAISVTNRAVIRGCEFRQNEAIWGSGIASASNGASVFDCVFDSHPRGRVISGAFEVHDCTFTDNPEGGLTAVPLITNSIFLRNSSIGRGAAIERIGGDMDVFGCVFIGNSSLDRGGAIFNNGNNTRIVNCLVASNQAAKGGGIYSVANGPLRTISHCTIVDNFATGEAGGVYVRTPLNTIYNSIVYGNEAYLGVGVTDQIVDHDGSLIVDNSCIEDLAGEFFGVENTSSAPLFLDPDGADDVLGTLDDDYRLQGGSLLIDLGDNSEAILAEDLDGMPRQQGGRVDAGAYERGGGSTLYPALCFGAGEGTQPGCTPCPCGNDVPGTVGGCQNSNGRSAILSVTGKASSSDDTLRFEVNGATPVTFAILISGQSAAPASPAAPCAGLESGVQSLLLDGLRCAVVGVQRHGTRPTDSAGDVGSGSNGWGPPNLPAGGILLSSGFSAGQTRYFQVFYRENAAAGCMRGQNTTQAVRVEVVP